MKKRIQESFGFLRTTAVGGLLFLLPVVALLVLLSYVFQGVSLTMEAIKPFVPIHSVWGFMLLFVIALAVIVVLCFLCGLIARRALAKKFSEKFEDQLSMVFPKYAIYKDMLADSIGGTHNIPSLTPILYRHDGQRLLAFEADRLSSGEVVVYLPGAPDAWIGKVAIVPPEHVESLDVPFNEVLNLLQRLGRNSASLLNQ